MVKSPNHISSTAVENTGTENTFQIAVGEDNWRMRRYPHLAVVERGERLENGLNGPRMDSVLRLFGHKGHDMIDGGTGWDKLFGGSGDDVIPIRCEEVINVVA